MRSERPAIRIHLLLILAVVYTAASFLHFSHNAEFIDEYPNLPAWLSRAGVYLAWLGVTAIGVAGYLLLRSRHQIAGLLVWVVYGLLGLDGLAHYAVAPVSAHTLTMNLTIGLEVAAATLLLAALATQLLKLSLRYRERAT